MFFFFSMSLANAQMFQIEPLNRVSAGVSYVDSSFGGVVGFESRLTHLIYLNIGGFQTLGELAFEGEELRDQIKLKSGLWAMPGLRLPHRYNKNKNAVNWDLIVRTGFGCFFNDIADKPDAFNMEPGGLFGADFYLMWKNIGFRLSGKGVYQKAYIPTRNESLLMLSSIASLEFYSQF